MATQVRIRRRGRIRSLMVAATAAALCLIPATTASAEPRSASSSVVSEARDDAVLPMETDWTLVAFSGLTALGIGSVIVKKAGI